MLLLAAALAATTLVALGLPRLQFSPGLPLPSVDGTRGFVSDPSQLGAERLSGGGTLLWLMVVGAGVSLLHAIWRVLQGARFASLLPTLLRGLLVVLGVCVVVIAVLFLAPPGFTPPAASLPPPPPPAPLPRVPLGEPPSALLWIVAAALAVGSVTIAAWLLRSRPPARDPLILVALEAEQARAQLLAGADARTVILACYARMSAVLVEERGIERPRAMTAREFGERLGSLGVPAAPLLELTRLFEAARYGSARPDAADVARAVACLGPIVEYCRTAPRES